MLHDEKQSVLGLDDFVELNDVRMLDYFQNVNLARNSFDVIDIVDLPLVENLDGDALARVHMDTLLHLAKRALSKRLLYLVVAYHGAVDVHVLIAQELLRSHLIRVLV